MTRDPMTGAPDGPWRLHPWWERVLIAMALGAIVLPGLATLAGLGTDGSMSEKEAPTGWVARFADRLAFRGAFVRAQAWVRYFGLGVSPQSEVIRGRDGWLFYADNGGLDDYLRERPFEDADLRAWASTLQHTQDALATRGVAYLFVIAPDKHVIYPEQMPDALVPRPGPTRADQLLAFLQATTSVHTLDLRPRLHAAKTDVRVYHRTDSHWNDVGAAVAAKEILRRLDALAPGAGGIAVPPEPVAARLHERVTPGMDLAVMLRLERWLPETRIDVAPELPRQARVIEPEKFDPEFGEPRLVTARADGRGPRALVYRDSFGSGLVPWLAEAFARTVFLWEYDVDPAMVARERPDVVIHEWASRRLTTRLPYDFTTAPAAAQQ